MKTKKNMILMAVTVLVSLILITGWTVFAGNGVTSEPSNEYEKSILRGSGLEWLPVGTWVVTVPTPMGNIVMTHSIHAQDSSGKYYGGIIKQYNTNPTLFGTFPEWEAGGDIWAAQTVRTGPDSFESTLFYHTVKKGEGPVAETVGIGICNATWRLTGPNTNEGESTLAVYLAEQDADGDGLPDEGQEPTVCMGFTYTSKRLTMMPGCVPPPIPEQN